MRNKAMNLLLKNTLTKQFFKNIVWFLLFISFFLVLESIYFKPHNINWFFERVFIEYGLEEPELMSRLKVFDRYGLKFFNDKLNNISDNEKRIHYKDMIIRNLDLLTSYRRSSLTRQQQLSSDILQKYLENEILRYSVHENEYLANHITGLHVKFPEFMIEVHNIENLWDAEAYLSRMSIFAKQIQDLKEIMDLRESEAGVMPPKFVLRRVISQVKTFIDNPVEYNILYLDFKSKIHNNPKINEMAANELIFDLKSIIEDEINPAYLSLIEHLERIEQRSHEETSVYHLPNGVEYYTNLMRIYSNSDSTIDEIHHIGLAEVAKLTKEGEEIAQKLMLKNEKSLGLTLRKIEEDKANYYSDDSIGYENCYRDINTLLKESFDLLPQFFTEYPQALKFIIEKPKVLFVEKDLLLNFKDIKNDSAVFILNIANIRSVPRHQLRNIVYGEFFGFFMQKWVESKIPEMPTFLKILDFEGFLEGWQLYMQRCAYENGNFKNDYEKLAYVQYELFLSAIIVVDTGIHAKKWTREAALVYLKDVTGLPDDFLREAVDKCIVLPAKSVVAKLGQTRITALKSYAQKKMSKNFDSKLFNTFVIKNGQMPLTVLNKEVIWEVIHKNDAKSSIFK